MEWYDQITGKTNGNTMNYIKTRMEKKPQREENSTIIMANNGILWCVRVSEFKLSFTLEGILYLYKLYLFR